MFVIGWLTAETRVVLIGDSSTRPFHPSPGQVRSNLFGQEKTKVTMVCVVECVSMCGVKFPHQKHPVGYLTGRGR